MMDQAQIDRIHDATKHARSYERYGMVGWVRSITYLLKYFSEIQTTKIMKSQFPRWAAQIHMTDKPLREDALEYYIETESIRHELPLIFPDS
jgi:hypothetical protein